jgi:hypothetical protein
VSFCSTFALAMVTAVYVFGGLPLRNPSYSHLHVLRTTTLTHTSITLLLFIAYASKSIILQISLTFNLQPITMGSILSKSTSSPGRPSTGGSSVAIDEANFIQAEPRAYTYQVWHNGMWYGLAIAACGLLLFCALLAGLTLAVCGLEMTWLQMRGATGTSKQRYTFAYQFFL